MRNPSSGTPIYVKEALPRKYCNHKYDFKYKKEEVGEEGNFKIKTYYYCRRCLEEKVE